VGWFIKRAAGGNTMPNWSKKKKKKKKKKRSK
jgi:hypothetical protein